MTMPDPAPREASKEAVEAVNAVVPCLCDVAYASRGLTAPDCPRHNYAADLYDAMDSFARDAVERAAKRCEALVSHDTDWDNSYWNQAVERCAAAVRGRVYGAGA